MQPMHKTPWSAVARHRLGRAGLTARLRNATRQAASISQSGTVSSHRRLQNYVRRDLSRRESKPLSKIPPIRERPILGQTKRFLRKAIYTLP